MNTSKGKWTRRRIYTYVYMSFLGMASMMLVESCSKTETPPELSIVSLKAGTIDLNSATSATAVPTNSTIVAEFSTTLDTTGLKSNITLVKDYDKSSVPYTYQVSGTSLTITPKSQFSTGNLYDLTFSGSIKSDKGKLLAPTARTFTTAGFFAPAGLLAHWGFESNGNDDAGSGTNYNAAASDIVDVSYVAGRNTNAGQAASFNGTTSIMEIPNGGLLANTSDFSMSFWVKLSYNVTANQDTVGHFIIGLGGFDGFEWEFSNKLMDGKMAAQYSISDGTTAGQDLWMDCTGNLGWQGWTYSKDLTASGGLPSVINGKWAQVVCTYASATKIGAIYLNGTLMKTQDFNKYGHPMDMATGLTLNKTAVSASSKLAFGFYCDRSTGDGVTFPWATYSDPTANHFKGLLDDVRIFHKALSQSEVTSMYNSENQ